MLLLSGGALCVLKLRSSMFCKAEEPTCVKAMCNRISQAVARIEVLSGLYNPTSGVGKIGHAFVCSFGFAKVIWTSS